jgi:hypothetical protein
MSGELYNEDELRCLTDYSRAAEQSNWLKERGIPHRREGSRVIVSRIHVRQWLEGRELVVGEGVNWGALNA